LDTLFIGKNFVELPSVDSTNTFAATLLASRPVDGTVVFAQQQTAGRGQQGSQWHAEQGLNLTFSIILYPYFLSARQIFLLNKLVTCALRDVVAGYLPEAEVMIKWPNDLLVDRKKISGILIETSIEQDRLRSAIIGIGLNLNQTTFEADLHGQATSLAVLTGQQWDQRAVLNNVLQHVEARYLAIRAGRSAVTEHDYLKYLFAYQEDTLLEIAGEKRLTHIVGVDADGRLAVQEGGKLYFYGVKEIKFVL
jgi:BirA family transcriptional regulator, biotin operon repressor / biotin---[acetyl-CoA-carboxylase] ligase